METKEHNLIEVVEFCRERGWFDNAEVVGRWVWLEFVSKPSKAIRQELKEFGWHWSPRRGKWAHNCGHPCRPGNGDPRRKYGCKTIADLDELAVAV